MEILRTDSMSGALNGNSSKLTECPQTEEPQMHGPGFAGFLPLLGNGKSRCRLSKPLPRTNSPESRVCRPALTPQRLSFGTRAGSRRLTAGENEQNRAILFTRIQCDAELPTKGAGRKKGGPKLFAPAPFGSPEHPAMHLSGTKNLELHRFSSASDPPASRDRGRYGTR